MRPEMVEPLDMVKRVLHHNCKICGIYLRDPELFWWTQQALLDRDLTQAQIAEKLSEVLGYKVFSTSLSRHRVKHLERIAMAHRRMLAGQLKTTETDAVVGLDELRRMAAREAYTLLSSPSPDPGTRAEFLKLSLSALREISGYDKRLEETQKLKNEIERLQGDLRKKKEAYFREFLAEWRALLPDELMERVLAHARENGDALRDD